MVFTGFHFSSDINVEIVSVPRPIPKQRVLPCNVRHLSQFEEIIFIKRQAPSKRLAPKNVPAFKVESGSPLTGQPVVIIYSH